MTRLLDRLQRDPGELAYALLAWILLLVVFHGIFGAYFPTPRGTVGHDFGLALAAYTDGFIWFAKNGPWAVPWFTPSFCGGQPFFADPQSGYYSVPQWLAFATDPLSASYLALLLFASLGFFGTYLLARRSFALPVAWAILAGAWYFFNGFLPHRMILGETGYHALSLAPWLALALLAPAAGRAATVGFAILAGAIAGYWLQSGLATLMVPAALSVGLVLLAARLRAPWPRDLALRTGLAIALSAAFSASKLAASLAFYSRFERTQYLLPGFDDPLTLVWTNLLALFGSSEAAARAADGALVGNQWTVFPHEWAYGFTAVPVAVLLAALALRWWPGRTPVGDGGAPPASPRQAVPPPRPVGAGAAIGLSLAMIAIAAVPLALQFYTPGLNAWYKSLPVIGATAWPMRWLVVYLPIVPIAAAWLGYLALGRRQDLAPWLVGAAVAATVGLNLAERRQYYADQPYRPANLLAGYARLADGGVASHRIGHVGVLTDPVTGDVVSGESRNDLVVEGVSQAKCYNPSFGYRLEKLPLGDLALGDVLWERNGTFNIKNPACYVFPRENGCAPGDHFRVDQRAQAEAFVSYRPFPFDRSRGQHAADALTMATLLGSALFLVLVWPWSVWRRARSGART